MENAVPDLLGVPPHAGTAFRLARPCAPGWLLQMMTDGVVTDRVPYQGSARLRGRVATPRGPGRLGQGACVLHEPPNPAEYTHLPISGTRPSCSTSSCHQKPSSRHMRPHHRPTRPLRSLSDGGLQCHLLRHVLALLADAGGVGVLTHPLED